MSAWRVSLRAPRGRDKNYSLRVFDPSGKEVKTRTTKTADPLEAERLRAQVESDFNTKATLADQPTFGQVWEAYATFRDSEGCGVSTKEWIHASRKALAALEHTKISEIDGPLLQRAQDTLLGQLAPRTVKNYMSCAGLCWAWARRRGHVTAEWPDLEAVKCKRTNKRPFTGDEVQQIFRTALDFSGGRHYSALRFLYDTGCRVSEMCRILERDINRDEATVFFPKTKKDRPRTVNVDREVLALLPVVGQDEPVFKSARGRRISRFTVHGAFTRICRAAGITRDVDVHSFRRTWSQDATQTPNLALAHAQEVTGHASLDVFLGYAANSITRNSRDASMAVRAHRASQKTPRNLGGSDDEALAAQGVSDASPSKRNGEKQGLSPSPGNGLGEPASQCIPATTAHHAETLREVSKMGTKYREALRALCLDPAVRAAFLEMLK